MIMHVDIYLLLY